MKRSPRKSAEEAIPTGVFDTEKHDEELRASYGADAELGYKPVFLYVERGPGQGQLVQVRQGQLVIGRASVSELRLQHPSISRRHAMVTRVAEQFYVKDLGSQNGSFVNKQRIATEIEIFPGDTIAMGNAVLKLRGPLQKGEGAPAPAKPVKQAKNKTPLKTSVMQRPKTSSAVKVAIFAGAVGFGLAAVLAIALLKLPSTPSKTGAAAKAKVVEKTDDVVVAIDEAKTRVIDEAIKKKMAESKSAAPAPANDDSNTSAKVDAPIPGQTQQAAAPAPVEKKVASAGTGSSPAPSSSGGSKRSQILAPYEKGDPDAALDLAKQAGDKDLTDKLSRFIKAYETANEAYVAGQGGPAIKQFEIALKLDEQLSGGWSKKGAEIRKQLSKLYTMVGLIHVKNGSDDDAKTAFAAAVKFDSTNDQAKAQLQILGGPAKDDDDDEKPAAAPKKASSKAAADDAFGDEDEKPAAKKAAPAPKKAAPAKSRSQAIDDAFGD
ncbi:MAG: FHA domain-containing protein [Myxococcaceae bacterium]|nr:FHA domain-containing protein [Myxococcaceae bacterium]